MTTDQTPSRYQVIDYKSVVDGKIEQRFAHIRDGIADHTITVTSEIDARDLIAKLSAWLDAPRLAARATAEVVASDEFDDDAHVYLLRTTDGEWGVRFVDDSGRRKVVADWHTGPDAERTARSDYADARNKAICICGAEVGEDEIDRSGDEPQCPKCVAAAVEAFKAQRFRCAQYDCNGSPCTGHKPCGWTGTGADLSAPSADFEPYECPKCGAFSVEEIRQ